MTEVYIYIYIYLYMAEATCLLDYSAFAFHKLDLLYYWPKSMIVWWIKFNMILSIYLFL